LRAGGTFVAVTVRPGPGRVGFVVSKKVDNRAVVRNRVKRRLRSILREEYLLYARRSEGTVDVVVAARPEARDASFAALHEDVCATLRAALARLTEQKSASGRRR
jgi:ribonuclease P protein component